MGHQLLQSCRVYYASSKLPIIYICVFHSAQMLCSIGLKMQIFRVIVIMITVGNNELAWDYKEGRKKNLRNETKKEGRILMLWNSGLLP